MKWVGDAVTAVLAGLALLHAYWAVGGRWGATGAVPERSSKPPFKPGPWACVAVAVCLGTAAALIATRAHGWNVPLFPPPLPALGTGGVALVLLGRFVGDFRWFGLFKKERRTPFARLDTWVYSPLCLLLGLGATYVSFRG
jgi:hypothetical protein